MWLSHWRRGLRVCAAVAMCLLVSASPLATAGDPVRQLDAVPSGEVPVVAEYSIRGDAIPEALTETPGDAARGRRVALDGELGNCSICHVLPDSAIPADAFGNLGPSLVGVGRRLDAGQLRLRIVDASRLNPDTVMPPYHRVAGLTRVQPAHRGRPILSAQQVEDLVAWLRESDSQSQASPAMANGAAGESGNISRSRSGYRYLGPELRALQDDTFANPGMLWLERGQSLWREPAGQAGRSCADCHRGPDRQMAGVAARYPRHDGDLDRVITLEQRINRCRVRHQGAKALEWESDDLLALTLFVTHQSRGMPLSPEQDPRAVASLKRGEALFNQRLGQLNLACRHCHAERAGLRLRGEIISQGQINGFPVYRLLWDTLASSQRMFAWCNEAVRAEPHAPGSQAYADLALFLAWRGRGLPVEAPAVRR